MESILSRAFVGKRASFKAKPVARSQEDLIRTSYLSSGGPTPLVIMPAVELIDLSDWIAGNLTYLDEKLLLHGGILFRGFDLHTQEDFQKVLDATKVELINYSESSTPRKQLGSHVYTSTEFPPDQVIALHNELSTAATFPLKIWFFALQPPQQGGETPIADVRNVYKRLSKAVQEEFASRGWMVVRNYNDGFGPTWQEAFHTADKSEVEDYCRRNAITLEWKDHYRLRTWQVRPAITTHVKTGEVLWFNHMAFWHISSLNPAVRESLLREFAEQDLPFHTYYGDGGRIEAAVIDEVRAAYRDETISFPWEKGDLLMLDNMLIAHGRNSYTGPRRILVGMGEPYTRTDLS